MASGSSEARPSLDDHPAQAPEDGRKHDEQAASCEGSGSFSGDGVHGLEPQFLTHGREGIDSELEVLLSVRRRDLNPDACLPLWNDRV